MNQVLRSIGGSGSNMNEDSVKELLIAVLQEEKKISSLLETIVHETNPITTASQQNILPQQGSDRTQYCQAVASHISNRNSVDQYKPVIQRLAQAQTSLAEKITAAVGKITQDPNANSGPPPNYMIPMARNLAPSPSGFEPHAEAHSSLSSAARRNPAQSEPEGVSNSKNEEEAKKNIARFMAPLPKYSETEKKKIEELLLAQNNHLSREELDKMVRKYLQSEVVQQNDEAETVAALLGLSGQPASCNDQDEKEKKFQDPEQKNKPTEVVADSPPVQDTKENNEERPKTEPPENRVFPEGTLLRTFLKPTDMHLVTQFTYAVLSELEVAYFTWRDRRGNRRKLTMGYPGMACRYCHGETGRTGRYFPSSVKTMADSKKTLFSVYDHLSCCQKCPTVVKEQLLSLFEEHIAEQGKKIKRHGSQRDFFRRVYNMLHSTKAPK